MNGRSDLRDGVPMLTLRLAASVTGVLALTWVARGLLGINATTAGFAYLVVVLLIASTWGFAESAIASVAATLSFNFFFLPPIGTFTIADPQNWAALAAFLTTSLVASRLSTVARQRAAEAIERQGDIERLYTFSRALLLIEPGDDFPKHLTVKLSEIFNLEAVVLFDRRAGEFFRAGPSDFEGLDDQLRDAALNGTAFSDTDHNRRITAVRLGSEPIASLALQGSRMEDSVLQGVGNLVAIGLERARAQELSQQIEAARQSEQLRTTLIDAMAHELKTPLTSIRAATSSLLSSPDQPPETRSELLHVADEEAEHLTTLIDDAIELARLDTANIDVQLERSDVGAVVRDVVDSLRKEADPRVVSVRCEQEHNPALIDRRLMKVAIKQLVENAIKYSPPGTPIRIAVRNSDHGMKSVEVTNEGPGIAVRDQARVFERFWRGSSVKEQVPGTGLGLSIAQVIARSHRGDLELTSRPGETTFRLTVPGQTGGDTSERGTHPGD
jgi:two-component system sensor histidine kinase KdpD